MANKTSKQKKSMAQMFLTFRLKGLKSYGKYLEKEFKNSAKSKRKKAYHKYITKELIMNIRKN